MISIDSTADQIVAIMRELNIDYYLIKTSIGDDDILYDELRVHLRGDEPGVTATANEFEQPAFGLLKELEVLVMGETS